MPRRQNQQACRKPEKLIGKPQDCTPERVRECHGQTEAHPCVQTAGCEHPERLEGRPGDCSPEQIRQCHGEAAGHPCESRQ